MVINHFGGPFGRVLTDLWQQVLLDLSPASQCADGVAQMRLDGIAADCTHALRGCERCE